MTINLERAALKGRLADDKQEFQRVNIRADSLLSDIRAILDPYADSVVDIDTARAVVLMGDLHKLKEKAVFLANKIKEMEDSLYG